MRKKILGKFTLSDVIIEAVFLFFMFLSSGGFLLALSMNADPIFYIFLDIPRNTTKFLILKYGVRPLFWGTWTQFCMWTFYTAVTYILFIVLYGSMIIPRVPLLSHVQHLTVIQNTFGYQSVTTKLSLKLFEGGYKEYRRFQVYIRPTNDANYFLVPCGLAGTGLVCVIGGFAGIRGYTIFPLGIYLLFPSVFLMSTAVIFLTVPVACHIFEGAQEYRRYWLSRFTRREIKMRLRACRPMGIAAGPFGYIGKSLPVHMMHSIIDSICSLTVTMSAYKALTK